MTARITNLSAFRALIAARATLKVAAECGMSITLTTDRRIEVHGTCRGCLERLADEYDAVVDALEERGAR
jgi:hypothetical protein